MGIDQKDKWNSILVHAKICSVLLVILVLLLALIDPPVTILGWILLVGIGLLLIYTTIQIFLLGKYSKS